MGAHIPCSCICIRNVRLSSGQSGTRKWSKSRTWLTTSTCWRPTCGWWGIQHRSLTCFTMRLLGVVVIASSLNPNWISLQRKAFEFQPWGSPQSCVIIGGNPFWVPDSQRGSFQKWSYPKSPSMKYYEIYYWHMWFRDHSCKKPLMIPYFHVVPGCHDPIERHLQHACWGLQCPWWPRINQRPLPISLLGSIFLHNTIMPFYPTPFLFRTGPKDKHWDFAAWAHTSWASLGPRHIQGLVHRYMSDPKKWYVYNIIRTKEFPYKLSNRPQTGSVNRVQLPGNQRSGSSRTWSWNFIWNMCLGHAWAVETPSLKPFRISFNMFQPREILWSRNRRVHHPLDQRSAGANLRHWKYMFWWVYLSIQLK